MTGKSCPLVVIGREYGSGGRRLGRTLAKRLSVPYFDKELLDEAARCSGIDIRLFNESDEKRPSIFRSFLGASFGSVNSYISDSTLSNEIIYRCHADAIRNIASQGGAVIVGRTADYILRDFPGLLSVFLHAPLDYRVRLILSRGEAKDLEEAKLLAMKHDKKRQNYYNYYTGRQWGKASNYHVCIDASLGPLDSIADMLAAFALKRLDSVTD